MIVRLVIELEGLEIDLSVKAMKLDNNYEILIKILEIDQNRISSLDSTQFIIKGWSITLVSLLVGFTFQYENKVFLYLGIVATILFGILDYWYRRFQIKHVKRSSDILENTQNIPLENGNSINLQKHFGKYTGDLFQDNSMILLFYFSLILMLIIMIFIPIK